MTLARLAELSNELRALRKQRDELIRSFDAPLREIAQAAGLSHETVRTIRNTKPERSKR